MSRSRGWSDCIGCGQPFDVRTYKQRFCSLECSGAARTRAARLAKIGANCPVLWADCRSCGKRYVARLGRKACAACRALGWRARPGMFVGPTTNVCIDCGLEWVVTGRGSHDRKRCPECQARFKGRSHSAMERQRKRSAKRIRRLRPALLEQYDGRCGICHHPIDLDLPWTHPLSLTIDHIHPISAGGNDDPANLWPAHRRCNEEKGDEIGWRPDSPLWTVSA